MADIELVIKIPNDKYKTIVEKYDTFPTQMKEWGLDAIKNGIPLPKGHGRLKDVSELLTVTDIREDGSEVTYVLYDEIENAPTIVEAVSFYQ